MSERFYDYIAETIFGYFNQNSSIAPGSRYSLKLDDIEMVEGVNKSLIQFAKKREIYEDYPLDDLNYKTYTINLSDQMKLVIATQNSQMTDDFFTTLRNTKFSDAMYPLLMITSTQNDSLISGTGNLSAAGMPFNVDTIVRRIRDMISGVSSKYLQEIYNHELDKKTKDRFTDRSSLFEYRDLIVSLKKGSFDKNDFYKFSLLPCDQLLTTNKKSEIIKLIEADEKIFNYLDNVFKHEDIQTSLENTYKNDLIKRLKEKKKNGEEWYEGLNLHDVEKSKIEKKEQMLQIEDDSIVITGSEYFDKEFIRDQDYFIRNEGETKTKSRIKNILIFNPDYLLKIRFSFKTNRAVSKSDVTAEGHDIKIISTTNKECIFEILSYKLDFARIEVSLEGIKYRFSICIINIVPDYFASLLTNYTVAYLKTSSHIDLTNIKNELVFNPGKELKQVDLYDAIAQGISKPQYSCKYTETLQINIDEEKCFTDIGNQKLQISVGDITIPFVIKNGVIKATKLTGLKVMMQKMKLKSSFEYRKNKLYHTTIVYDISDNLRKLLNYEDYIIKNKALYVESDLEGNKSVEIDIDHKIKDAYEKLIDEISNLHTLPSLVYYGKGSKVRLAAENYIRLVSNYFTNIQPEHELNIEENDLLKLGLFKEDRSYYLTPLHPLNVLYQLQLTEETGWDEVREDIVKKLNGLYLIPFIKDENGNVFKAIDQEDSLEWKEYALETDEKYHSSRSYISKLVNNKIVQYRKHFDFLFSALDNLEFKINLVNMGDCREVLNGLLDYFVKEINHISDLTELMNFTIHIYSSLDYNEFHILSDQSRLKSKLEGLYGDKDVDINELLLIAADHIHCFYHDLSKNIELEYSHLTFYEMDSNQRSTSAKIAETTTGLSLNGLLSDVPSVERGEYYITGYGTKYVDECNLLVQIASYYNTLMAVAFDAAPYDNTEALYTRVNRDQEALLDNIYKKSNWVVFVDPKVDLSFFKRSHKDDSELMIIHYSDQYSSTSGYDDITVTEKSKEYSNIIREYFESNAVHIEQEKIYEIINLFNAVNGDWLLNLLTKKNTTSNSASNFSREKMSILSAIKYCKAKFKHDQITWVPISLEEMLRVSGALGLSKKDGLLSAKNLHFDKGSTSDDILMVGIENSNEKVKVYLHPVEVKIGQNDEKRMIKAQEQIENTYIGLWKAFWPDHENARYDLEHKISRNFFIQLVIVSAEKMKLYDVDPEENWERVLCDCRQSLLDDHFSFSREMDHYIGRGTIISFDANTQSKYSEHLESNIWKNVFNERSGFTFMTRTVSEIYGMLRNDQDYLDQVLTEIYNSSKNDDEMVETNDPLDSSKKIIDNTSIDIQDVSQDESSESMQNELHNIENELDNIEKQIVYSNETHNTITVAEKKETYNVEEKADELKSASSSVPTEKVECKEESEDQPRSMKINFGTNISNGKALYWYPNDTTQVIHTNTGIIGTMGTGKTQFTKSLITQLYLNQKDNYLNDPLGILIFDYKGDYNKPDSEDGFKGATNAEYGDPYHFPFNPLALTKPKVFRPLLPIHVANTFKDTLTKIFQLGNKQESTLFDCIKQAYISKGIIPNDPSTWDKEPPTFETVYKIYNENEEIKKNDSLAAAMNKLHNFEVFEPDPKKTKPLFDILNGVYVIELSGFNDDIQNLVVAITLDLFYNQMQSRGSSKTNGRYRELTKFILVDEADNFMSQDFSSLKKILKEGREFGVGVILSTQFLSHFGTNEDDYSKYILTWVVHKVSDLKGQDIDYIFGVAKNSQEEKKLMNDISFLEKHHSIVKIDNMDPIYIEDKPFWKLREELNESSD